MTTQKNAFEILLAEDNPADVIAVQRAIDEQSLDCVLHVMKDGAQAIAFIENLDNDPNRPRLDLALFDMHLPKHDGEEILIRLRSTERYARTPVIVMTAAASPYDQQKMQRHAALHYFRKPSTLAEFMQLGGIVRDILTKEHGEGAA